MADEFPTKNWQWSETTTGFAATARIDQRSMEPSPFCSACGGTGHPMDPGAHVYVELRRERDELVRALDLVIPELSCECALDYICRRCEASAVVERIKAGK